MPPKGWKREGSVNWPEEVRKLREEVEALRDRVYELEVKANKPVDLVVTGSGNCASIYGDLRDHY